MTKIFPTKSGHQIIEQAKPHDDVRDAKLRPFYASAKKRRGSACATSNHGHKAGMWPLPWQHLCVSLSHQKSRGPHHHRRIVRNATTRLRCSAARGFTTRTMKWQKQFFGSWIVILRGDHRRKGEPTHTHTQIRQTTFYRRVGEIIGEFSGLTTAELIGGVPIATAAR